MVIVSRGAAGSAVLRTLRPAIGGVVALAVVAAAAVLVRPPLGTPIFPAAPSVGDVQAAYDRAAALARDLHDGDLRIVGVDCHAARAGRYSCQVGFMKVDDDPTRVYLDGALLERAGGDWTLLRGLCRRLL